MTVPFRQRHVLYAAASGLYRLGWTEWGDPANPEVLLCAHGLTRSGRDFDTLAHALADRYRVVCPDMPGRGTSDWLANPMEYAIPTYVNAVVTLIAKLGVESVDWVGTSMGGLIGMAVAASPRSPIRRMVVNEAGPVVQAASLERLSTYLGRAPRFADFAAAETYVRMVSAPFGPHTDDQWRTLTEVVVRRQDDGSYVSHYDPAIAVPFNANTPHRDLEMWPFWEAIRCPTLVIRGELSDLLTRETVARMAASGPHARTVEFAGIGHAPTLMQADQIAVVRAFLLEN